MLRLINSYKEQIQDDESVCFAIWFHDVIYDTRRSDNEEQSAKFAQRALLKLNAPPEVIGCAKQLILATKKHRAEALGADAEVFLDADLSILGTSEQVYLEYSKALSYLVYPSLLCPVFDIKSLSETSRKPRLHG